MQTLLLEFEEKTDSATNPAQKRSYRF